MITANSNHIDRVYREKLSNYILISFCGTSPGIRSTGFATKAKTAALFML